MVGIKPFICLIIILLNISCKKDNYSTDCKTDATNILYCNTINKNSTVNGYVQNFYPDSVKIESEGNYNNGIPTGFWKFYYLNGNLKYEGNYTNQKQIGFCKEYFENGFIKEEGNFKNCVRDGFFKFYHETMKNQVEHEGNYMNGVKTGIFKYYDEKGNIIKTIEFKC